MTFVALERPPEEPGELRALRVLDAMSLAGFLFICCNFWVNRDLRAELCSGGVRFRSNGRTDEFAWGDVALINTSVIDVSTHGVHTGREYRHTLKLANGRKVVFHNALEEVGELGERTENALFPVLLKRAEDRLASGERVSFGPVALTATGLSQGNSRLAWGEVGPRSVRSGVVTIHDRSKKRWFSRAYASVSNARVFLRLLKQRVP